jgi:preprotein translocase subunit Sec63
LKKFNKAQIAMKCRILGVNITDPLPDIKKARDRLVNHFHPDKNLNITSEQRKCFEDRIIRIQNAYKFIKTNYDEIQEYYKYVDEHILTSRGSSGFKAHWIYSRVEKYKEN